MSSIREILIHGELEVTGRLVDASNATLYAECTFESTKSPVIYKPIAGERPLWDFPDGQLAHREFAAYLVSEIGEWFCVPTTILRDGPFGEGMVQEWIEVDEEIDLATFFREDDPRLRSLALFDAVINNTDRKIGHLLPRGDGRLFACDHGVTFHEDDKLRTVLWQWAGKPLAREEVEQLQRLLTSLEGEHSTFLSLITESEFKALKNRIRTLISSSTFPEPNPDWPAVPWPPF
jgi:hypothetical protein